MTVQEPLASAAGADGKALGMQKLRQRNPCEPIKLHLGPSFHTVADAARSLSQLLHAHMWTPGGGP